MYLDEIRNYKPPAHIVKANNPTNRFEIIGPRMDKTAKEKIVGRHRLTQTWEKSGRNNFIGTLCSVDLKIAELNGLDCDRPQGSTVKVLTRGVDQPFTV